MGSRMFQRLGTICLKRKDALGMGLLFVQALARVIDRMTVTNRVCTGQGPKKRPRNLLTPV